MRLFLLKVEGQNTFCYESSRTKETHTNDYRVFSKMADHLTLIPRPSPFSKMAAESNLTLWGR